MTHVSDGVTPAGIERELVPPPAVRPGVCTCCRSWADGDEQLCRNCYAVRDFFDRPAVPVSVITMYRKPSLLRDWLTGYKGRTDDAEEPIEPRFVPIIRGILAAFFDAHTPSLQERLGGFTAVATVPSTSRPPPHPLLALARTLDLPVPVLDLLRRGPGDLGFSRPAFDGFLANDVEPSAQPVATRALDAAAVSTQRLLILDDVYTTGSRLNSAAYALRQAGHEVAGSLVVGRRINPDYHVAARELWDRQSALEFDWVDSPIVNPGADK